MRTSTQIAVGAAPSMVLKSVTWHHWILPPLDHRRPARSPEAVRNRPHTGGGRLCGQRPACSRGPAHSSRFSVIQYATWITGYRMGLVLIPMTKTWLAWPCVQTHRVLPSERSWCAQLLRRSPTAASPLHTGVIR